MEDPAAAPDPGAGDDHLGKGPAVVAAVAVTRALAPSAAANLAPAPAPSLEEADRSHPEVAVALGLPRR